MAEEGRDGKRFLKKMTEPKYHKVVVGLIEAREKVDGGLAKKSSFKGLKSLIYTSIVKKSEALENDLQSPEALYHSLSCHTNQT